MLDLKLELLLHKLNVFWLVLNLKFSVESASLMERFALLKLPLLRSSSLILRMLLGSPLILLIRLVKNLLFTLADPLSLKTLEFVAMFE